jgi:hypothetical protein
MDDDGDSRTPFRELAHRATDGLEVAPLWSERENRVAVSVSDSRSGELFVVDAANDNAARRGA